MMFPRISRSLKTCNFSAVFAVLLAILNLAMNTPLQAQIIENGKGRAEIVLGEKPARMAKFAAKELQTYLEKITGAKLPIVNAPSKDVAIRIFVGKSAFTDELGLKTDGLKHGAFRTAAGSDWLALLGPDHDYVPIEPWGRSRSKEETARLNQELDKMTGEPFWNNFREVYARYHKELDVWDYDDTGTLNAVYAFLRAQGVRWFSPGEVGEVVPKKASIALPSKMNEATKPDFALRRFSYFTDFMGIPELSLWNLRLGVNQAQDLVGMTQVGHGMKFVLMRDEMKKAHPEFYALWDGMRATDHRGTGAPSLGAPGLKEMHLKYARAVFDHYKEPMLSLDVIDGFSGRISEEDSALATPERGWAGSMSDYVWGYVNDVAKELYKTHPDRMVSGLAYSAYFLPPEKIETMSPNLAIIECRHRSTFYEAAKRDRHREARRAWLAKLPSGLYFTWDYYLHAWAKRNPGRPVYFPRLIAEDLRDLKGVSMGDSIEVYNHRPGTEKEFAYDAFAINHLNLYVTSRLWWDANLDLDALLEDYYSSYYGPAKSEMKAFIEYSEANWMHMTRDLAKIEQALSLAKKASDAVEAGTVYAERVNLVIAYLKPLEALKDELKAGRKNIPEAILSRRDSSKLKLDGNLDDEFWKDVPKQTLVGVKQGEAPATRTEFMSAIGSDGMLYFAIRCEDPDMKNLLVPAKKSGDFELWNGDFIELLLETPATAYYQITIDPSGHVVDLDRSEGFNDEWKSGAEVATSRGADSWTVEVRIPPAGNMAAEIDPLTGVAGDLPTVLEPWYANVCRSRPRDGKTELTAWSPTGGNFHKPIPQAQKAFGRLQPAK